MNTLQQRIVAFVIAVASTACLAAAEPDVAAFRKRVEPFLTKYCVSCHGSKLQKAPGKWA